MSIDKKTVNHVAALARLALSDAEREQMRSQMSPILEHINVIGEAYTGRVPATAHILPLENVMRQDQPCAWEETDLLVENAPAHEASYIRVRAVLDHEE